MLMTVKLILAFILAFAVSSVFGNFYVPWLKKVKVEQEIKENGPTWHISKSGTPTMGGVMFILAAFVACITVGFDSMREGKYVHLFVFVFALAFGAIGFLDDWEKIKHKANLGLHANTKFLLQLAAAIVFVLIMRRTGYLRTDLYIPFFNKVVYIPDWAYMLLSAFIIVGTVNSVNITDGVDGLASGTSIPVFLFFVTLAYRWGARYLELGIFASAMIGGLLGFLIYNYNPAKVFMGDTGSLALGGFVASAAVVSGTELYIPIVGFIYMIEVISVIIQVGYFKATHGKRFFKMAPIHHHFELLGNSETRIVAAFTIVTILLSGAALIGALHH
jgi:phospho-N-acetylmuramoyl-pentapeptide-transferase